MSPEARDRTTDKRLATGWAFLVIGTEGLLRSRSRCFRSQIGAMPFRDLMLRSRDFEIQSRVSAFQLRIGEVPCRDRVAESRNLPITPRDFVARTLFAVSLKASGSLSCRDSALPSRDLASGSRDFVLPSREVASPIREVASATRVLASRSRAVTSAFREDGLGSRDVPVASREVVSGSREVASVTRFFGARTRASRVKARAGLQTIPQGLPLLVEVPLEVEVPHAGTGNEVRLRLGRVRIQAAPCVRDLMGENHRSIVQGDQVDLPSHTTHRLGPEVQEFI